jgi:hypothetical protein
VGIAKKCCLYEKRQTETNGDTSFRIVNPSNAGTVNAIHLSSEK